MKEVGRASLEISSVRRDNSELHTDDQKAAKAKGELLLNQVSSSGANSTSVNLHPHLESCQVINKTSSSAGAAAKRANDQEMKDTTAENGCGASSQSDSGVVTQPELSYNYPDLVGQRQQPVQVERKDAPSRPLCEESLKMSGIKVSADFPMIDDDEGGDESSVLNPDKSAVDVVNSKPDLVEAVLVKTETVTLEPMPVPCYVNAPQHHAAASQLPSAAPVLKSALKKSNGVSSKKKGLRVSFHDTRVFYIDTEAEANAEPQLLTVHSLDLPLAPTDFRVFIPAYDFLPPAYVPTSTGFKPGVDRSYTYEDAIVSLQSYVQKVNNEDEDDSEDEEFVAFNDVAKQAATTTTNDAEPVKEFSEPQQPSLNSTEVVPQLNEAPDVVSSEESKQISVDVSEETVRCLTEANLREHEMILMEQDSLSEVIEQSRVNEKEPETQEVTPNSSKMVNCVVTNEKTLSPPLKELMVDVSVLTPSGAGANHPGAGSSHDNWQVELSPLNSIPGDSETESSTSSQDTIIMMTSEESERNENHIKQSQMTFNQLSKKDSPPAENGPRVVNETSANVSVCSQDSDETLKYDGNYQLNAIRNVDVEGNLIRSNATYVPAPSSSASASSASAQRTSSQIRQLMERNAVRRNLMRYSNTRLKKATPGNNNNSSSVANEVVNDIQPIERQRQWRSHESLLDTIKKLTLEESQQFQVNENEGENEEDDEYPEHTTAVVNGFNSSSQVDERNFAMNGLINGNLSLQDIRALVNGGVESNKNVDRNTSSSSTTSSSASCEAVPGDLRQWKIRSNQWQLAHNHVNGGSNGNYRWTSLDALQQQQQQQQQPVAASVPLLKNGVARCATLKEQYNNKDFYRVSLSHNYSQSDDHLEMVDDEDLLGGGGGEDDELESELPDELSQFVQMDSGRIERLRKRYSYSDMDNYANTVNAFNRRSSVRGIKPRFGSTSEILKQMQNQLQPPPLANHRNSHMTWPYPNHTNGFPNDSSYLQDSGGGGGGQRQTLPVVQEEIYGSTKFQQQQPVRSPNSSSSIYASLAELRSPISRVAGSGRASAAVTQVLPNHNVHKQPPPYQPPPSPSMAALSQRNAAAAFNVAPSTTSQTTPLRIHTKDERGVPEGASSSPKVLSDSVRHYHSTNNTGPAATAVTSDGSPGQANSGVVYYVMQV